MKKISTLFKKDPNDLGRVINEVDPENEWALTEGVPYRKWDGSACAIIDGDLYKRYDAKHGKKAPFGSIPCCDPDPVTGHHPHWLKCDRSKKEDQYFWEAFDHYANLQSGSYELIGEKVQGNTEKIVGHMLIKHDHFIENLFERNFDNIKDYLSRKDIEGIVFHHPDGRMCKIRKSDFGIKR